MTTHGRRRRHTAGKRAGTQAPNIAIPGFELVEELGRGATTAVYRALRDGADYAVKVQHLSGRDDPARINFRREAAILAAIRHPCLGKVFEVGDDGSISWLVMELIAGKTLADAIDQAGSFEEAQALAVAADVASALDAAHRVGLVHRDVSPRNVVLRANGPAVLIDFGLATPTGIRQAEDSVVGTVLYSAPEQTGMVRRPVDRRSDLYSLGAVLFECLAGEPPFNASDAGEIVHMHAAQPAPDVRVRARHPVSGQLARIVARLMAKDPDDRYQEAGSLLADIEALRRGMLTEDAPLGQALAYQGATFEHPLIGRDQELAAVAEVQAECRRGGAGATVIVESEPGGGRTRLVAEMARSAREQGVYVLEAHLGTEHHGPLGPLASAVGRFLAELEGRRPDLVSALREQIGLSRAGVADSLLGLSIDLDRFLPRPRQTGQSFHEFAVIEAAHLVMAIAAAAPSGAVLIIDNAHLADDATHRVLAYLAPELTRLDLFVVLSTRNDRANSAPLERLRAEMGESVRRRLELQPLTDEEIGAILTWQLGGDALEPALANEIAIRANGNPGAAVEYLRSALDAGVLRPSWGRFSVDAEALAGLDLTTDLLGLALNRLSGVRPATRWLLTEASVIGPSVPVGLLVELTGWPEGDVYIALDEATNARVVEPQGPDRYAFLNEGVRDSLLASIDEEASRRAHEMLARVLDTSGDSRPEAVYDIARHYAAGEVATDPERALLANHRAAKLALAARADDDALRFLAAAADIAATHSLGRQSELELDCGTAFARAGRVDEALAHYERALMTESDAVRRAGIELEISEVHHSRSDGREALRHVRAGLACIGRRLPESTALLVATSLLRFLLGALVEMTRVGFGKARDASRDQHRLEARLLDVAVDAANSERSSLLAAAAAIRSILPASRLGPGEEHVGAWSRVAALLAQARHVRSAARIAARTGRAAAKSGEAAAIARARLVEGVILEVAGDCVSSEHLLGEVIRSEGRFLQPAAYAAGVMTACVSLGLRGRILEQVGWLDQARWHVKASEGDPVAVSGLDLVAIAIAGLLEQPTTGLERVTRVAERLERGPVSPMLAAGFDVALATFHFGLNELGEPFERAVTAYSARRFPTRRCPYAFSFFYVAQAFARLAQGLRAEPADRARRLHLAEDAVEELRRAARTPVLRAHYQAARAGLLILKGRPAAALEASSEGQRILIGLDAPGAEVALLMARSRALSCVGHDQEAERLAVAAARLAEDFGLSAFVRWIEPDLPDNRRDRPASLVPGRNHRQHATVGGAAGAGGPFAGAGGMRGASRAARQLDALLQVGAAAARVLDPEELSRLALDETVRILNAERALLFLTHENSGIVRPHLGRDAAGNDLGELAGYSSTIVDKVASSREPIVLTGTEEGAALGSESAVTHGLRSILVAPLQIEDRLLGIVYLDSRLAKGIFTHDDVEILSAITSHVAFALETARLAEMEMSVASERRQRQVAELLRDSMRTVGQSLEPRDVLQSILHTSVSALGADAGAVLLAGGERLEILAAIGPGVTLPAGGYDIARSDEPEIAEALRSRRPLGVASVMSERNSPLFGLIGRSGSFIVAPLVVREVAVGSLVVIAHRPNAFGQTQIEVADALARQGVVAYENAQLFARVQTLAQRDELSGVANRRHFFELAGRAFSDARDERSPLSAMMLDIDHFKEVNDRFGHASGDDVIRAIAQRIAATIGSEDLIGRYGGEEFALVVRAPLHQAVELAERLRNVIAESPIETASGLITVTASVGVAELGERDADLGRLLSRTDSALYEAKRSGRDRVSMAA
ncbi:MAG: diguanylate cyclase [Acidimicrobiales bacterium]